MLPLFIDEKSIVVGVNFQGKGYIFIAVVIAKSNVIVGVAFRENVVSYGDKLFVNICLRFGKSYSLPNSMHFNEVLIRFIRHIKF